MFILSTKAMYRGRRRVASRWIIRNHNPRKRLLARFYAASNDTGFMDFVVPNVIHYVRNGGNVTFWEAVSLRSAYLNHGPDQIVLHCDPCKLGGRYAEWIEGIPLLRRLHTTDSKLREDMESVRTKIVSQFGGIALDDDMFVIRSLHRFRRMELSLDNAMLGQVLIGNQRARLLRMQGLYRRSNTKPKWLHLVSHHPHLVHRIRSRFYAVSDTCRLWGPDTGWLSWPADFTVPLKESDREHCTQDPLRNTTISEATVRDYNTVAGQMARSVLFGTIDPVGEEASVLSLRRLQELRDADRTILQPIRMYID
ncbi:uncharacterized protein LOC135366069 isoform X2 [Ornithodoros turicata]|uniref:uncharacterized protein LOC135366069 isoform X2 n=1 Tax=Ornithodoros turicata TaxID=34597 RepID=UPI003138BB46